VVERHGTVRIVDGDGEVAAEPFVDLSANLTSSGLEQGLLGLAFHPDYPDDDRFFVHYTGAAGGETTVSELRVSDDPDRADPDSEEVLLSVGQPASNHNGGMIAFGPDGMLYVAIGDGGGAGDAFGQGQDPSTLLGTILRLDVGTPGGYEVPDDNPWADGGEGAAEVWAYGLRNPWKIAFDHAAELLYIADVGQNDWQSVNIVPAGEGGLNHGWPILEGSHCFEPPSDCPTEGLVLPAYEYPHAGSPSAIIGGFVYVGEAIPELQGTFLYSDYGHGWLNSFTYDPAAGEVIHEDEHLGPQSLGQVYGFGEDGAGEVYVLSADGTVHRVVTAE
jgi:glucose/arabinose dehydrogenase